MPVLHKLEDGMFVSEDILNTTSSAPPISLTIAVTTEPVVVTTPNIVYVIKGEMITTQPPQTWISCMDDIMTSQSLETWILLGCTFISTLIFVLSMIFILFSCCCCSRRKVKRRRKINKRKKTPSRCLPPGIPQPPPVIACK